MVIRVVTLGIGIALIAFLAAQLRREYLKKGTRISIWLAMATVCISFSGGLAAAGGLGYLVMFTPSLITGDFIGLPWFTMIPALLVAGWVLLKVTNRVSDLMVKRYGTPSKST